MRKNTRKISIPFWTQILAILLAGMVTSGVVLLLAPDKQQTAPPEAVVEHTVTFAYPDGTVIETKAVEEGKGVFPPAVEGNGVFRGWNTGFNAVMTDIEVHPIFYGVKEENLFYFNSVYTKEDTEFSMELYVGGKVSLSSGTVTLSYDTDVLEFKSADNLDCVDVTEKKAGELTVQVNTEAPLQEQTQLSKLVFYAKKKDAYSTQIDLTAKDAKVYSGGDKLSVNYATINNKIYFLQEVGE